MSIEFNNSDPLYRQIAVDIKSQIKSGELSEGEQLGSHQVLAERYQVSLITIKKALSELINEGVLYSRVGKGTFVAGKSPFVIHSKHKTIGVVLRDLKNPFFSLIVHRFEEVAYEAGYNILLSTSSDRMDKEEAKIRRFVEMGVDALLVASMSHRYRVTNTIRKLHEDNFPYVMVSYIHDDDIFYVGTDHARGAFLATEHLLNLGFNSVAYLNGAPGSLLGELRQRGYANALKHHGKPVSEELMLELSEPGEKDYYQAGYKSGKTFAPHVGKVEAVYIYNDLAALGFVKAMDEMGIKVPDDVAVVGNDNIKQGQIAPVPLTTVHQPTAEIGRLAAGNLIGRIQGKAKATRTILRPRLIVRESCGAKLKRVPMVG